MPFLIVSFGFLAISQLLLMGLFYLWYFREEKLGLLLSLLSVCLISYALYVISIPDSDSSNLDFLLGRLASALPAVLWLIAHFLFVDDKKISPSVWSILIGYQILRAATVIGAPWVIIKDVYLNDMLDRISELVMLALTVHVIVMAMRGRSSDLVEERRKLRVPFAIGFAIIIAAIILSLLVSGFMENVDANQFLQMPILVSLFSLFVFALIVNLVTFRLAPDSQLIVVRDKAEPKAGYNNQSRALNIDPEQMKELDQRMLQDKLFADPELTIRILADTISMQEYKLRVLINQGLGYKNFNQFLNSYRINEACKLLADRKEKLQISTVALEVGYASLSSFNLAFKAIRGETPSSFKSSLSQ